MEGTQLGHCTICHPLHTGRAIRELATVESLCYTSHMVNCTQLGQFEHSSDHCTAWAIRKLATVESLRYTSHMVHCTQLGQFEHSSDPCTAWAIRKLATVESLRYTSHMVHCTQLSQFEHSSDHCTAWALRKLATVESLRYISNTAHSSANLSTHHKLHTTPVIRAPTTVESPHCLLHTAELGQFEYLSWLNRHTACHTVYRSGNLSTHQAEPLHYIKHCTA